jgi:hypothetical protein
MVIICLSLGVDQFVIVNYRKFPSLLQIKFSLKATKDSLIGPLLLMIVNQSP